MEMYICPFVEKYFIPSLPSHGILLFIIQDKFHISKRPGNILYVLNVYSGKKKEFVRRPFFCLVFTRIPFFKLCMFVYLELSFAQLYRKKDPYAPRLRPHRLSFKTGPSICPKQGQDFEPSAANGSITHPSDLLQYCTRIRQWSELPDGEQRN